MSLIDCALEVERVYYETHASPEERAAYRGDHERRAWRFGVMDRFSCVAEDFAAAERTPTALPIDPELLRQLVTVTRDIRVGHERGLRDPEVLALALRLDDFLFESRTIEERAKSLRLPISELQSNESEVTT